MQKEITCTKCPNGCRLHIVYDSSKILELSGNQCPRGIPYAQTEIFDPRRLITSTVVTNNRELVVVPVRTSQAIPVKMLPKAMELIHDFVLDHAVVAGDILIKDFIEPGIDLIATRSCP